ncbi:MAG: SH3 domain-containing protein [Helicobacteraceae bacterium]|nr:SH3 domain-containing protein [Helicobacteraceae bacterium]
MKGLIFLLLLSCFSLAETMVFPKSSEVSQEIAQEPQEALESSKENLQDSINLDSTNALEYTQKAQESQEMQVESFVKNVYLELLSSPFGVLYVNQVIAIDLKMLIFAEHTTIKTDFIFESDAAKNSVEILNPNDSWRFNAEDSSFLHTIYLKIKQINYAIPQIKVIVNTKDGEASDSIVGSVGRAVKLEKGGDFSQVLAQELKIVDTKITSYDATQNLIVLQLQSKMGNLFDFKLESYAQQGIESKSGDYKKAEAFYYVIANKDINPFVFEYFNLSTSRYESLQIANYALDNRVSTQSDIKPKNNFQFFKISIVVFFAILFFALYLYKRKIIFVLLGVLSLSILVYFLTLKTSVILKPNVALRIQPTFNSTIILTTEKPLEARILGNRGEYVKVILEDERIGWVKKDAF